MSKYVFKSKLDSASIRNLIESALGVPNSGAWVKWDESEVYRIPVFQGALFISTDGFTTFFEFKNLSHSDLKSCEEILERALCGVGDIKRWSYEEWLRNGGSF